MNVKTHRTFEDAHLRKELLRVAQARGTARGNLIVGPVLLVAAIVGEAIHHALSREATQFGLVTVLACAVGVFGAYLFVHGLWTFRRLRDWPVTPITPEHEIDSGAVQILRARDKSK